MTHFDSTSSRRAHVVDLTEDPRDTNITPQHTRKTNPFRDNPSHSVYTEGPQDTNITPQYIYETNPFRDNSSYSDYKDHPFIRLGAMSDRRTQNPMRMATSTTRAISPDTSYNRQIDRLHSVLDQNQQAKGNDHRHRSLDDARTEARRRMEAAQDSYLYETAERQRIDSYIDQYKEQATTSMLESLRKELTGEVVGDLKKVLAEQVRAELGENLTAEANRRLKEELRAEIFAELREQRAEAAAELRQQYAEVITGLREQREEVIAGLREQLTAAVAELRAEVVVELRQQYAEIIAGLHKQRAEVIAEWREQLTPLIYREVKEHCEKRAIADLNERLSQGMAPKEASVPKDHGEGQVSAVSEPKSPEELTSQTYPIGNDAGETQARVESGRRLSSGETAFQARAIDNPNSERRILAEVDEELRGAAGAALEGETLSPDEGEAYEPIHPTSPALYPDLSAYTKSVEEPTFDDTFYAAGMKRARSAPLFDVDDDEFQRPRKRRAFSELEADHYDVGPANTAMSLQQVDDEEDEEELVEANGEGEYTNDFVPRFGAPHLSASVHIQVQQSGGEYQAGFAVEEYDVDSYPEDEEEEGEEGEEDDEEEDDGEDDEDDEEEEEEGADEEEEEETPNAGWEAYGLGGQGDRSRGASIQEPIDLLSEDD